MLRAVPLWGVVRRGVYVSRTMNAVMGTLKALYSEEELTRHLSLKGIEALGLEMHALATWVVLLIPNSSFESA